MVFLYSMLAQVLCVCLKSIEQSLARCVFPSVMFRAEPALYIKMLRAFMTLPVGFAAKSLCTMGECTAVRSFMSLLVFSDEV